MSDFSAAPWTQPTLINATQVASAGAAWQSGVPVPNYFLACFDTAGVRHRWVSSAVNLSSAPVIIGGATYVSGTLVVLRKF